MTSTRTANGRFAAASTRQPGPGSRVSRSAGQAGGGLVLLELWAEFGWLGAGDWSTGRWRAVTATTVFLFAMAQNVAGWLRER